MRWPMTPVVPYPVTPAAWTTRSRAVCRAVVKPQRSGSVPGRDSVASTMTVRRAW
ncbi:hypothetical protein ACIA8E_34165 [Streptomyces sp. NPDC051664]|uniref:hypothetical protein n=1 Tax=Streptomyces sp. NPDC051664 TaxID=3365668 RepID=UPI0037A4179F